MRGVYTATVATSALAAARTLIYITAPSAVIVEILELQITNKTNETNEQLEATWQKVGTLGTPTATTLTPTPMEPGDQAAASTVKGNVTASEPTYTSNVEHFHLGFSSLAGYLPGPLTDERPIIQGGQTWGLRMLTSTFAAIDTQTLIVFREIG